MRFSPFALLLPSLLVSVVTAELFLTQPNATSFLVAGGQIPIAWNYTGTYPATISVELVDNSKQLFTGPLALFSNLMTTSGKTTWSIPKVGFVGDNFSIILVANTGGTAVLHAQSETFAIKPEGTPEPPKETVLSSSSVTNWNSHSVVLVAVSIFGVALAL